MVLSDNLVSSFVEITKNDNKPKTESTLLGTVVKYGNKNYVKLDGSELLTPISSTTSVKHGDRVMVLIKEHSATITGNISSPSVGETEIGDVNNKVENIGNKITEFEIVIADKVSVKEFEAEVGRIDNLVSDNVIIKDTLTANKAEIEELKAGNVVIEGELTANKAEIENLKVSKLDAEIADIKFATIENLNATNITVNNLQGNYGEFKDLVTNKFTATDAEIKNLKVDKLDVKEADMKYANIDFANIGSAAIENLFSKSGLIGDLVVGDGTITGTLVGVTIKGDLIEGGTVVADKLVIKGSDGLYYKLNTNGETVGSEQTEYNSLNGSIITAKSVTAEKISVKDLVAFGATIGGFKITDHSMYSGVKESAINTTRGVFLGDDGQFAVGDQNNYLKFFKDTDGKYKLAISASSITFGASGGSVEDELNDTIEEIVTEFYLSSSTSELNGGSWSSTRPTWTAGKYIWFRTKTTKKNGEVSYSAPACISGNKGEQGIQGIQGLQGEKGDQGIQGVQGKPGIDGKTQYTHIAYANSADGTKDFSVSDSNRDYIGMYVDFIGTDSTVPSKYAWSRIKGAQGATGSQGIQGKPGADGKTPYLHIAYANSADGRSGFSVSDSVNKLYIGQYTDYLKDDSIDPTKYSWSKIKGEKGDTGSQGVPGTPGKDGKTYYTWLKYADTPTSGMSDNPTGKAYIGLAYNKTSMTESSNYSDYTWSKIKGEKGDQGIPGGKGADGKTYYTWIKYATSNAGANMSDDPTGKEYIGFAYNKTTATESNTPSDYTWSKIKGEKGDTGSQGVPGTPGKNGVGISKSEVLYYLSTSNTTQTGGSWVTTPPAWVNGRYYWQKIKTTFTDGSINESKPVCISGEKGSSGNAGSPGQGVSSITTEFYLSTSKTTQSGGSWVTTMPTWTPGKYLWTRSKIVYVNPSSTKYTTPICDSSWEAVNGIEVGGRNLVLNSKGDFVRAPLNTGNSSDNYNHETFKADMTLGETYTISADIEITHGTFDKVSIYPYEGGTATPVDIPANKRVVLTFTKKVSTITRVLIYAGVAGATRGNGIIIRNVKIEKGNKATDWTPAPEDVDNAIDEMGNALQQSITDQSTNILSNCEHIILEALTSYTKTNDFNTFKETLTAQLKLLSDQMTLNFTKTTQEISDVNKDLQDKFNTITKYFKFDINGLTIGQADSPYKVIIDNDRYSMTVNDVEVMWIANGKVYTPEIEVTKGFKLFGYTIDQDEHGNVNMEYTGGV